MLISNRLTCFGLRPSPTFCNRKCYSSLVIRQKFVLFAHAALGSPSITTFINAINLGYFTHWPRLTAQLIRAHLPHTIATAKGHLNQHRQGVDSTKILLSNDDADTSTNDPIISHTPAESNHVYLSIQRLSHQLSSDLTGRFPVTSDTGSLYVLVTECDGYIHAEAMASRSHPSYVKALCHLFH